MMTGDEKWIVYNSVVKIRPWCKGDKTIESLQKQIFIKKKVSLSVWWNFKDNLFFELLPRNEAIDYNVYYRRLDNLNQSIMQKRSELVNRK